MISSLQRKSFQSFQCWMSFNYLKVFFSFSRFTSTVLNIFLESIFFIILLRGKFSSLSLHWSTFTWRMISLSSAHESRLGLEKSVFVFRTILWVFRLTSEIASIYARKSGRSETENRSEINSQKEMKRCRILFGSFVKKISRMTLSSTFRNKAFMWDLSY
jgi:hypothetical protein